MSRTIQLGSTLQDRAIRAGSFELMPTNPIPPTIVSQPIRNIDQYTWATGVNNGVIEYQQIKPAFNTVKMLIGTSFSFLTRVTDFANVNDVSSLSDVSYKWSKDDGAIHAINQSNGGTGLPGLYVLSEDCTPLITGRYTCEISNQYGSVVTDPIDIEVIDPLNHPKLYKNLILNPDGDGGLDGWQGDPGIIVSPFVKDPFFTKNFGSFRLGGFATFLNDSAEATTTPLTFRFGQSSNNTLFYKIYTERLAKDPTVGITTAKSDPAKLNEDRQWIVSSLLPQIVANEDYDRSEFGGFFPGLAWMDAYNKNDNSSLVGLLPEFRNTATTYFGRGSIKFQKYNEKPVVKLTQTVDVSDVADLIDGTCYGVQYITSQFFAYVGIGISDYKIKVQTTSGEQTLNYYIADSEEMYNRIIGKVNPQFPDVASSRLGPSDAKIELVAGSDIEIIPQCYDKTTITLTYLDANGIELKQETINGPNERDIWALKEKTYFPATLYGLYEFIRPNNNTIKVFGQKYTDTNALTPFFETTKPGLFSKMWSDSGVVPSTLRDKAVIHLLNKYDWQKWYTAYPGNFYYSTNTTPKFFNRALPDYGAAAMIGVGKDIVVPKQTRSVQIQVSFTHNSDMFVDINPDIKRWKSRELYSNEYGTYNFASRRLTDYGTGRCGITKMKFLLAPNNIEISDKHLSYTLPPAESTVLGLQKARYNVSNAFNTADVAQFTYPFIQPANLPPPQQTTNPFINAELLASYIVNSQQATSQGGLNEFGA